MEHNFSRCSVGRMLIRRSSFIADNFLLLTLGEFCCYALHTGSGWALFDCGLSTHSKALVGRLRQFEVLPSDIHNLFITNSRPERIGGLPLLRKLSPNLQVHATAPIAKLLRDPDFKRCLYETDKALGSLFPNQIPPQMDFNTYCEALTVDSIFPDSETFQLPNQFSIRGYLAPGCTQVSTFYYILPINFLVADQGLGYYRGRELAAPGGDYDLMLALETMKKFSDIELNGLALPLGGVLTGSLIREHLSGLALNTEDLLVECQAAFEEDIPSASIQSAIDSSFYRSSTNDPLQKAIYKQSFDRIWQQVLARKQAPVAQ